MPEASDADAEAIARAVEAGTDDIVVPAEMLVEEPEAATPPLARSLYAQIINMGIGEKIKLALRGNRDARAILIRDAQKLIRRFVLQNPRVTDTEVVAVARNRSADEELLRVIADRREWMRNYQIRLALATNPKTPLVLALKQLTTLTDGDLRLLTKSKNVSATVASQARRILMTMREPR
jgi:hypothetical protein